MLPQNIRERPVFFSVHVDSYDIESVKVIGEYICSDHLPLRVVIRCDLATNRAVFMAKIRMISKAGKQLG